MRIRTLLAIVAALALLARGTAVAADAAPKKPNILVIMGDDIGWFAYIRIYGPEQAAFDGTWKPGISSSSVELADASARDARALAPLNPA